MKKRIGLSLIPLLFIALTGYVHASGNCSFSSDGTTMTLLGSCTTDATIVVPVPNLTGNGYTITAVDPAGDHFRGAVVQAGTDTLNVDNLNVTSSGLAEVCDAGADRLRGILWDGASGSATQVNVDNINEGPNPSTPSGCQEGNSFEVRNFGGSSTIHVLFDTVSATHYQKTGIVCNGDSVCTVTDSTIVGDGPQPFTAQNGVQFGFGASGSVKHSEIDGNAYTGNTGDASGGILLVAGPFYGSALSVGAQFMDNVLKGNDIGVWLSQINADGSSPTTQTNVKVVHNNISNPAITNLTYQAGVSDQGKNDKIDNNTISGAGYQAPGLTVDSSSANKPHVHANK
jgi:hypothetical protein